MINHAYCVAFLTLKRIGMTLGTSNCFEWSNWKMRLLRIQSIGRSFQRPHQYSHPSSTNIRILQKIHELANQKFRAYTYPWAILRSPVPLSVLSGSAIIATTPAMSIFFTVRSSCSTKVDSEKKIQPRRWHRRISWMSMTGTVVSDSRAVFRAKAVWRYWIFKLLQHRILYK